VDAFANNLVETKMGCMTDLSTEEVIMNNEVKPPEESDFPKMHLVVLDDTNNDNHLETPYRYDPSGAATTIRIAFVIPYSTSEFNEDLQFVVEVEEHEQPIKEDAVSAAAEFVAGGSIGCEHHRRLSARHMDNNGLVVLRINDPTAKLRVWAGWATGHSAVRLVPDLILEPGQARVDALPLRNEEREKLEQEVQEIEEEIQEMEEEMEEEMKEEEFSDIEQERLLREQEEAKLEQPLLDRKEPSAEAAANQQDQQNDKPKTATQGTKLKRKRKNMLERPENIPKGLEVDKGDRDLGLEILPVANPANGRGNGNKNTNPRTMQQKIRDKTLDIDPRKAQGNNSNRKKTRHKLTDHTASSRHRGQRDSHRADNIAEEMLIDDGGTDDDLPEVLPEALNDDFLPDEGDVADDDYDQNGAATAATPRPAKTDHHLDITRHFMACGFFAVSMGTILLIFGKKRDKGRRDL